MPLEWFGDKLITPLFKLIICKNGGEPPMQIIGAVPDEYKKLVEDNVKIREALKSGKTLDFAILGERGEHLRIKWGICGSCIRGF